MRVGIVIVSNGIGGTEKRLATLFRYLVRHSSHSYYLAAPPSVLALLKRQSLLSDGMELYDVRTPSWVTRVRSSFYTALPLWRRAVMRAVSEAETHGAADVLHYALPISYFVAPPALRRRALVEAQFSTQEWHLEFMIRRAVRGKATVNCLSQPIQESLARGLPAHLHGALHVSPGSVMESHPRAAEATRPSQIAFVGRLEHIKSPLLFVDAVAALAARRNDFRAVMLGDGRLRAAVEHRIAALGLDGVIERVFHDQPRHVLQRSRIFVSLQTMDNYPSQALLEAMDSECAVVASDVGSTRTLVTDDTGLVVPLDARRIADAIDALLADPDRASSMGSAGRAKVQREHSVERYAAYIERLYAIAAAGP